MIVLAYNYYFKPDNAYLVKLDGTIEKNEKVIEALRDPDVNVDTININDGDYIEVSYNDESIFIRTSGSPEDILNDLIEIAKDQWDDEVVYFEGLGGTELDTEDYNSPEELAKAAYDIYYTNSYVDGDSNFRNEIIHFNASEYIGAEQWLEKNIATNKDK